MLIPGLNCENPNINLVWHKGRYDSQDGIEIKAICTAFSRAVLRREVMIGVDCCQLHDGAFRGQAVGHLFNDDQLDKRENRLLLLSMSRTITFLLSLIPFLVVTPS